LCPSHSPAVSGDTRGHGYWFFGGTVAAVDITDEKLKLAAELGADIVIDAREEDPTDVLHRHGGADVAIGLAVDDRSFATAYKSLRPPATDWCWWRCPPRARSAGLSGPCRGNVGGNGRLGCC